MKRISVFLLVFLLIGCSKSEDVSLTGDDKLYVFQKNIDPNTPDIFTKLYEANPKTGSLQNEIGGYERLQARIYYDLSYLKNQNEFIIRQSVYEGGRGEELVGLQLNTKKRSITSFLNDIYDLTVVNDRLFGFKLNNNSADLVEVDVKGNILMVIQRFNNLVNAPDNNKRGLDNLTFSKDKQLLIVKRRESFYFGDPNKLFVYDIKTKIKKTITIGDYDSVICGNNAMMFALKTVYDSAKSSYYNELVEFDINTGSELRTIYTFNEQLWGDSEELIFLPNTNQVVIKGIGFGYGQINVDTGEVNLVEINYDYRDITGLNAVRILSF